MDFTPEYVGAICYMLENGEEKLINAVERGVIARRTSGSIPGSYEPSLADIPALAK